MWPASSPTRGPSTACRSRSAAPYSARACRGSTSGTAGPIPARSLRPAHPDRPTPQHSDRPVKNAVDKARGLHGSPRLHADLRDDGWTVSEKTVAESMRRQGLVACRGRRRNGLTRQDKAVPKFPDLVKRDFGADRPNAKWVGRRTIAGRAGRSRRPDRPDRPAGLPSGPGLWFGVLYPLG